MVPCATQVCGYIRPLPARDMCCYETVRKTGQNTESGNIPLDLKLGSDQAIIVRFVSVMEFVLLLYCFSADKPTS